MLLLAEYECFLFVLGNFKFFYRLNKFKNLIKGLKKFLT